MTSRRIGAVDILVGQRLRAARLVKGVTQHELGEAVGVTFQQIQKYENGKNRIGTGRLHAMAELLGVSMSFFFENIGSDHSKAFAGPDLRAVSDALSTKEGVRIAASLARIQDIKLRRRIADLLDAIIANETKDVQVAE